MNELIFIRSKPKLPNSNEDGDEKKKNGFEAFKGEAQSLRNSKKK